MTTTSAIEIHRRPSLVQPALRYRVLIDGVTVSKLALSQDHVATVASGRHSIQIRVLWMSSKELAVEVAPNEVVKVDVWPDAKHFWNEFTQPASFLRLEVASPN
jgi:hypothetical protein